MVDFFTALVHLDPIAIIQAGGYLGLALLVFAESGLLIGVFFPGDSLLFAAGLLAAGGFLAIIPLMLVVMAAAILGDSAGYWFGAQIGASLFTLKDSRFFKQEYVQRTKIFYETYGGRAIILARFVPVVRTIAPILAGVGEMTYRTFLSYNVIGGCLWGAGMIAIGFSLGTIIPNSEHYVLPLSLVIVAVSFFPIILNLARNKRTM